MRLIFRLYTPLLAGLALLLGLLAARMLWHGSFHFLFIPWNIFLAALPLLFAHIAVSARRTPVKVLCAGLWLLFFPNSAYLITDIVHLRMRDGTGFWLDLVLLFGAGMYGIVLGLRSLRLMEGWYSRLLSKRRTMVLTVAILLASGYGIYLGRVERWNSWDLLFNTGDLLSSVFYDVRHPFRSIEVWSLSAIFAAALALGYLAMRGRLRL